MTEKCKVCDESGGGSPIGKRMEDINGDSNREKEMNIGDKNQDDKDIKCGYEVAPEPNNKCKVCGGTGLQNTSSVDKTCYACRGTGTENQTAGKSLNYVEHTDTAKKEYYPFLEPTQKQAVEKPIIEMNHGNTYTQASYINKTVESLDSIFEKYKHEYVADKLEDDTFWIPCNDKLKCEFEQWYQAKHKQEMVKIIDCEISRMKLFNTLNSTNVDEQDLVYENNTKIECLENIRSKILEEK